MPGRPSQAKMQAWLEESSDQAIYATDPALGSAGTEAVYAADAAQGDRKGKTRFNLAAAYNADESQCDHEKEEPHFNLASAYDLGAAGAHGRVA